MSIEKKIAEILAESKLAQAGAIEDQQEEIISEEVEEIAEEAKEGHLTTDGVTSVEGEEYCVKKNNVDSQEIGGAKAKVSNVVNKDAAAPEASHLSGVKEDIDALTDGEDLSEEFKQKATTIFEAAVMNRVKQEVAKLDEAFEVQLQECVEEIKEGLVEKVDGYLDYVVEQWMEQNEIALERGMKSEILEGFVSGLKGLFEEHYIDVPEERFDVLGTLEEEVQSLQSQLDEQAQANQSLAEQLTAYQRDAIVSELSEGMADTDKEKFSSLVEGLSFDSAEGFERKVQTIRESYFTTKAVSTSARTSVVTDSPIALTEEKVVPAQMKGYLSILDNLK